MYQRILVPLDGSELAESILPVVQRLAGGVGAETILLRVVEPLSAGEAFAAAGVVLPDTLLERQLEAKTYLEAVRHRLRDTGIVARPDVRTGAPAGEIAAAATAHGADLIAMATHGRGGLGRLLFGSVAEAVLRTAPVPVLMIRSPARAGTPAAAPAASAPSRQTPGQERGDASP
jgi:nucleotide-binding universal stress UspA family protein